MNAKACEITGNSAVKKILSLFHEFNVWTMSCLKIFMWEATSNMIKSAP